MFEEMSAARVSLAHVTDGTFTDLLTDFCLITWKVMGFL